jgi:hypothetical protein
VSMISARRCSRGGDDRDPSVYRWARIKCSPLRLTTQNGAPPRWIEPQLCKLVANAPTGDNWVARDQVRRVPDGRASILAMSSCSLAPGWIGRQNNPATEAGAKRPALERYFLSLLSPSSRPPRASCSRTKSLPGSSTNWQLIFAHVMHRPSRRSAQEGRTLRAVFATCQL